MPLIFSLFFALFLFCIPDFAQANTALQQGVGSTTIPFINAGKSDDGATSSTALGLQVNGTEMMRVTSTGSVGIGTTTPSATQEISGDLKIGTKSQTCDPNRAGVIQWTGSLLQFCNGTAWTTMNTSFHQQVLTASGSFTASYTGNHKIVLVGGGGGGGSTTTSYMCGAGGGGGGTAIYYATLTSGTAYTVTVGAGGAASGTGGSSTIVVGATTVTAGGGSGGAAGVQDTDYYGGKGGTATNGTLNISGGPGQGSGEHTTSPSTVYLYANGGNSTMGGGGLPGWGNGSAGGGYGAGGGGSCAGGTGGSGAAGVALIEWVS